MAHKRPVAAFHPSAQKLPRAEENPNDYRSRKISWRVARMDIEGQWSWQLVSRADFWPQIHGRLKNFESMTWAEIERDKHCHPIEVRFLCQEARERLLELKLNTVDSLYQLHVTQKARLWGIRNGTIFDLIWWDPEHLVYPVAKKNT